MGFSTREISRDEFVQHWINGNQVVASASESKMFVWGLTRILDSFNRYMITDHSKPRLIAETGDYPEIKFIELERGI